MDSLGWDWDTLMQAVIPCHTIQPLEDKIIRPAGMRLRKGRMDVPKRS